MAVPTQTRAKYGVEKLSPILDLMVGDILRELPADPQAFMTQWLDKPPTDGQCYADLLRAGMQMQAAMMQQGDGQPPDAAALAALAASKPELQIAAAKIVRKAILEGCRMEGELCNLGATAAEAPFLHQFFKLVGGFMRDVMLEDSYEWITWHPNEAGMKAWLEEHVIAKMETMKTESAPLLAKSFRHHDSDGDDVLNRDEAAKFFSHVVSEEGPFMEMAVSASAIIFLNLMRMMKDGIEEDGDDHGMGEVQEEFKNFPGEVEKMKVAYLANKAERDAAAFRVCDTNGDGTLQLDEVMAALMPGGPKNDAFIAALGFKGTGQDLLAQTANLDVEFS